jgi:MFS family permease
MHLAFMSGYAMLIHLAKYVTAQGGDVGSVAMVFGLGMTGSLISRPFVGRWIDWVGCRPVLVATTFGAAVVAASFMLMNGTGQIAALRIALQLTQAAFLSSIAVAAADLAPPGRSAECLATLGVSGIAGMMVGPIAGDWIFAHVEDRRTAFHALFTVSASIFAVGGIIAAATRWPRHVPADPAARPPYLELVRRHWPGAILLMGFCLAFVQTVPNVFIERFATSRHLGGITLFFAAYSPTAIILRIALRTMPRRIGRRWTLLLGMGCYVIGLLALRHVERAAGLVLPAMVMGAGHCFTYPFLVDLAADRMPAAHRGVAVSLILATVDLGSLTAFFVQGQIIKRWGFEASLPATAWFALAMMLIYGWSQRRVLRTGADREFPPAIPVERGLADGM